MLDRNNEERENKGEDTAKEKVAPVRWACKSQGVALALSGSDLIWAHGKRKAQPQQGYVFTPTGMNGPRSTTGSAVYPRPLVRARRSDAAGKHYPGRIGGVFFLQASLATCYRILTTL